MTDIEKFLEFLDNLNNMIDISLKSSLENNSENLEINILNYIQEKYPFMVIGKGYMLDIINNGYKPGTDKYKDQMKFKVADIKYELNSEQEDLNKTLELQINKVNTQFNSISLGSNINYLDYVKNTLGCIMKFLRDKSNDSMAFAKNSMKTREDIEKLIADSYKITMKDYGENLKENFKTVVGLSDHTLGSDVAVASVAIGAKIIEKHFILDRTMEGPDSDFSMEPDEFKQMVDSIRNVEKALGKVSYELSDKMKANREFSRSLFAVKDIKKGELITKDNVKSIRPGFGLHPKYLSEIVGCRASEDIERGTPFKLEFVNK